jgi:hypothetical protein
MDWPERLTALTPAEATKLLEQNYEPWEIKLAERRFWNNFSIIHGKTRLLRPEYFDIATARKVATAVRLMEIIYNKRVKWNKAELKQLFNESPKTGQ